MQTRTNRLKSEKRNRAIGQTLTQIILIPFAITSIFPFLWMLSTALKSSAETFAMPPTLIPNEFMWSNFSTALTALPFGRAYLNSFIVAVTVTAGQVLTSAMAGYSLSKLRPKGSVLMFWMILVVLMVPYSVTSIPRFMMLSSVGLVDSLLSLIVLSIAYQPLGVYMCRQFCYSIPGETVEAAIIDGCSYGTVFFRIILPLIKPALSSLTIFCFMWKWNDYMEPLIFLTSAENFTVPLLLNMFRGRYSVDWSLIMAGACIAVVPVIIIYCVGQKYIIEGIALTGSKS